MMRVSSEMRRRSSGVKGVWERNYQQYHCGTGVHKEKKNKKDSQS